MGRPWRFERGGERKLGCFHLSLRLSGPPRMPACAPSDAGSHNLPGTRSPPWQIASQRTRLDQILRVELGLGASTLDLACDSRASSFLLNIPGLLSLRLLLAGLTQRAPSYRASRRRSAVLPIGLAEALLLLGLTALALAPAAPGAGLLTTFPMGAGPVAVVLWIHACPHSRERSGTEDRPASPGCISAPAPGSGPSVMTTRVRRSGRQPQGPLTLSVRLLGRS
jgi:hypothetical protein